MCLPVRIMRRPTVCTVRQSVNSDIGNSLFSPNNICTRGRNIHLLGFLRSEVVSSREKSVEQIRR